ncbi:sulfotransferase family protein [Candidatus Nitrotoga arctica]|uniref:Sulfotransferase family protein n=1 Tax=Candidatus Nitrotoga arctica TaxID=453162 RepID=A0ABN8ALC1_9PROT|nr:sulfotransferase [Candidatus Nitrotoga arctica]CAG9933564.1 Sulfotransferase family protein [Candidatus Nitrotoga arctica]
MMLLETIKKLFKKKQSISFSFIVGTGRCGTTMLAQMLNSHSMICVPHELQILFEYSNNGARLYEIFKEKMNENFGSGDFIDLIETRCPHKFHEYFDYRNFFEKQQYPIRSLKELVNSFYSEIAETKHKKIFIEQTPWYGQRIDILNELFPDAKYIHMVRDGRDVAVSFARTPWWHNDIGQNLERWHTEVRQIIDLSNKILNPNQMLQVRYEDFVEQPEVELRRICEHLGVNFEYAMLDTATYVDYGLYSILNARNVSSAALNEWRENKSAPIFKGSRYAWKSYPDFDFSIIPEHISQSLQALDYQK